LATSWKNLRYGYVGGIDEEEVRKIYNYMHNRLTGKAPGGEFKYNVCDDTGELVDEDEVPFSLISPETKISWIAREEWDADPSISTGYRVAADTFIFADAPAVQRAAIAQGYDAIVYPDVFQGGEDASEKLFGCDVTDLDGVWEAEDLDDDDVPMHWTLRLIDPSIVVSQDATPTAENPQDLRPLYRGIRGRVMKKIVPLEQQHPARRRVAIPSHPVPIYQMPIDDVAKPRGLLDDVPFISLEVTCQRIERVGGQAHISQRSLRMHDGVVETEHVEGTADAAAAEQMQRYLMYETLGPIFGNLLPPRK